ncbi:hypothetical protein DPMN_129274 [Dreissena polymorpha]|uniref:DUF7869 domain-containing protein n=1 Tax=Dreissena polymorpha TaxID=45954 RepID=A0A9D4H0X4_DREPO|nr:hypothetical protein DPMN_129274 [Dreissena polymorpha]
MATVSHEAYLTEESEIADVSRLFRLSSSQVGKLFFKTPRKCEVYGISCEGSGKQVHHYLNTYGLGEQHAHFQCDYCCGQNKNNIVIWYLLWRVLVGLHKIITLSFMLIRHTKFTPDWHFGIWKSKWSGASRCCGMQRI